MPTVLVCFLAPLIAVGVFVVGAQAQTRNNTPPNNGYTIQTPGRTPTTVTPTPGGGATIQRPGQLPTTVTPNPGGYTVQTPGQMPTTVQRR